MWNHYKGKYRIEANYDEDLHDVPREEDGSVNKSYDDTYIACLYGNRIIHYGGSTLIAYIPSLQRGHRIIKELSEENVTITNIEENDEEILFRFKSKDIEVVAEKLKAKTLGANISPFSPKRLPKNKNVQIPTEIIEEYKKIINRIPEGNKLVISHITNQFLNDILAKEYKVDVKTDMRKMMLGRQPKEYIFAKNMFNEYLDYLEKKINELNR